MTANKNSTSHWVIATDFDGTLTQKDVGNEIHKELKNEDFYSLQAAYRRGELPLKELQLRMWQDFPISEKEFCKLALKHASLREGVNEFLEKCFDHSIPVYVTSCGILQYIETVINELLSEKAKKSIHAIECNHAKFDSHKLSQFIPPISDPSSPYPLDKGAWIKNIRKDKHPHSKILGIGNGTSDRSFAGQVDLLAATEGLAKWCLENQRAYIPFENFHEIDSQLGAKIFQ